MWPCVCVCVALGRSHGNRGHFLLRRVVCSLIGQLLDLLVETAVFFPSDNGFRFGVSTGDVRSSDIICVGWGFHNSALCSDMTL